MTINVFFFIFILICQREKNNNKEIREITRNEINKKQMK